MKIYRVKARPIAVGGPAAVAFIVAEDTEQALLLLRKDIDFSGYRMPPEELLVCEASREDVKAALGAVATHEIGVYGFTVLGDGDPGTPPAAVSQAP